MRPWFPIAEIGDVNVIKLRDIFFTVKTELQENF